MSELPRATHGGHSHSHMLVERSIVRSRAGLTAVATSLGPLAAAGAVGFLGNELAAQVRLRAGRRLQSPALVADGKHARIDGFVSLGVVASAVGVGLGMQIADPIVGLLITLVILKITWDAWRTVTTSYAMMPE